MTNIRRGIYQVILAVMVAKIFVMGSQKDGKQMLIHLDNNQLHKEKPLGLNDERGV
jgi:hypothetical protein